MPVTGEMTFELKLIVHIAHGASGGASFLGVGTSLGVFATAPGNLGYGIKNLREGDTYDICRTSSCCSGVLLCFLGVATGSLYETHGGLEHAAHVTARVRGNC